jgi:hypothetical protein
MFPVSAGFITRPQSRHDYFAGKRGYSDFHTFQWIGGQRRYFLITQCKGSVHEHSEVAWTDGATQLQQYMIAQHLTRPVNARTPVYGILAVGRRVRFFRYKDTTQAIESW